MTSFIEWKNFLPCPIMDTGLLRDITGVTGQPRLEGRGEEEDLLPHKTTLPFAGDEIQPPQTRRPGTGEETLWAR